MAYWPTHGHSTYLFPVTGFTDEYTLPWGVNTSLTSSPDHLFILTSTDEVLTNIPFPCHWFYRWVYSPLRCQYQLDQLSRPSVHTGFYWWSTDQHTGIQHTFSLSLVLQMSILSPEVSIPARPALPTICLYWLLLMEYWPTHGHSTYLFPVIGFTDEYTLPWRVNTSPTSSPDNLFILASTDEVLTNTRALNIPFPCH